MHQASTGFPRPTNAVSHEADREFYVISTSCSVEFLARYSGSARRERREHRLRPYGTRLTAPLVERASSLTISDDDCLVSFAVHDRTRRSGGGYSAYGDRG
ncbi:hypothetical protein HPB50_015358 [Hyalomma asiaticum]|uniref:Uncharacterized protein n=1 Tax=Hyalomma asiaticum TaxID=266040 RepID=A0ACB7SET5_HYAAI|nr:hypothetical protein HPB50_015358 [Hyalomma asiaticum]